MSNLNRLLRLITEVEELESAVVIDEPMTEEEALWWELSKRLDSILPYPQQRLDFLALVLGNPSPERTEALEKFQAVVGFSIVDDMNPLCLRDWFIYLRGDYYWLKGRELTQSEQERFEYLRHVLGWNSDTWAAVWGLPPYWREEVNHVNE